MNLLKATLEAVDKDTSNPGWKT